MKQLCYYLFIFKKKTEKNAKMLVY